MKLILLRPQELELDPEGVRENANDIDSLAATIRTQGLLQPLGVTEIADGQYRVVYGGRRLRAVQQLGFDRVPCVLVDAVDDDLLVRQVIENVQRQDLNDLEKARAFQRLRERFNADATQDGRRISEGDLDEQVGAAVGLAARTVRRYLGLLDLPPEIQQLIKDGDLGVTQAQHLRRINNQRTQIELARMVSEEGLSAAEVSNLANYFAANPNLSVDAAMQVLANNLDLRTKPSDAADDVDVAAFSRTPVTSETSDEADDFWADETEDDQPEDLDRELLDFTEPQPKIRVTRIHSLDQMVDEADRLSRAYHEGDLHKWVERDENASFKLRLLLKQLRALTQALEVLVGNEVGE